MVAREKTTFNVMKQEDKEMAEQKETRTTKVVDLSKEFVGRVLDVTFDKARLHNSIVLHMRLRGYPRELIGTDLLKGVIFGKLRHPDITINEAVENAVTASKFPGSDRIGTFEAYELLFEAMNVDERLERKVADKLINEVIDCFTQAIQKEYCYEVTVQTLNLEMPEHANATIGWDLVKCMLFKKVYASESTWQCMKDYACRKIGEEIGEKLTFETAMKYVAPYAESEGKLEYILEQILEKIYENYPYTENEKVIDEAILSQNEQDDN